MMTATIDDSVPTFSSKRRLVRVPNRMGKGTGDVVCVQDGDGCTPVLLGPMVPFDRLRLLDTTARYEYEVAC